MQQPKYSVVIPVYDRPQEIREMLESLTAQTYRDFEVIVVEDGSSLRCDGVVDEFRPLLPIRYIYKPNSGPGPSRNEGFSQALGSYFVVFDSDCVLPPGYFEAVENAMRSTPLDAWGGPDKAHHQFTVLQRAMGYTMSSLLTTGGIRGGQRRIGWFQPRSFNMGLSRKVFETTGGFKFDRFAEDIELSIRMKKHGFRVGLIADAFVYHKRRISFRQFFRQVFNFGKGRAMVGLLYPEEVKVTHWFPAFFTIATAAMLLLPLVDQTLFFIACSLFATYLAVIFFHALATSGNLVVAACAVPATLLQFFGYGLGFLQERLKTYLR